MTEDEVDLGGHIKYEAGISLDEKQTEYWSLYTAENREKFFWLFLNSFVDKWQQKVRPDVLFLESEEEYAFLLK